MKEYKVETAIFYSKLTTDREHIVKSSQVEIQGILNRCADEGWILESTDAASFGAALYFYLYFSREKDSDV